MTWDQKIHLGDGTSEEMWKNLESIHEIKGAHSAVSLLRNFHGLRADDETNIIEHLNKLKAYYVQINQARSKAFRISEVQFKATIAVSLPASWDTYTEPYIGESVGETQVDYRKQMSSEAFIGDIIERYRNFKERAITEKHDHVLLAQASSNQRFADRIAPANQATKNRCLVCNGRNHYAKDCHFKGKPRCFTCGLFGHIARDCKRDDNTSWKRKKGGKEDTKKSNKKQKVEQTNEVETMEANEAEIVEVRDPQEDEESMEMYNIEDGDNLDDPIDERLIF